MSYEEEIDEGKLTYFGTFSHVPLHQAVNLILSVL
jgi:hypothetical protein